MDYIFFWMVRGLEFGREFCDATPLLRYSILQSNVAFGLTLTTSALLRSGSMKFWSVRGEDATNPITHLLKVFSK
jgi:hypothetical protein